MTKKIRASLFLVSVIVLGLAMAGCDAIGPSDTTTTIRTTTTRATTTTAAGTTTTTGAGTTTTTAAGTTTTTSGGTTTTAAGTTTTTGASTTTTTLAPGIYGTVTINWPSLGSDKWGAFRVMVCTSDAELAAQQLQGLGDLII